MLKHLRAALQGISVYKEIAADPLMKTAAAMLDALVSGAGEDALARYTDLFCGLCREGCAGLGGWLWDRLRYQEAPYPASLEAGCADPVLADAAQRDVTVFLELAQLDCGAVLHEMAGLLPGEYTPVLERLPRWAAGAPFTFQSLTLYYRKHGCGLFARYRAFLWENGTLAPVAHPDCMAPRELRGYERQREEVLANTRALLEGKPVHNVLLYGDSGTGKSVTVKSLLAVSGFENLRLIEVEKDGLSDLPRLIRTLGGRRQSFILFLDDLTFEQDDRTYSALKTILEGGLERRPDNVAIYATSNRRTLVRQTFSDRAGDEVDLSESIQERTSLAERFGLRIPFLTMSRAEFLSLVEQLAALHGITMESEALRTEAVRWEMHHPGRTPRTARQFLMSLTLSFFH